MKSIDEYEKISEEEAKKIFKELGNLNENQNTIDLNFIRQLLSINNNQYSPIFLKFITQYKLIDTMKNGNYNKDSPHNIIFNEEEFVNFITGKETKELLFDDNMDLGQKRFKIDDYAKLYELIGGDQNSISKDALKQKIKEALMTLNKSDGFDDIAEEEANEVIELLSSNGESLTPEDFMNIMTSNTSFPENLDDILSKK